MKREGEDRKEREDSGRNNGMSKGWRKGERCKGREEKGEHEGDEGRKGKK